MIDIVWSAGVQFTELDREETWDPVAGLQVVRSWRALPDYIEGLKSQLFNAGIKWSCAPDEGPYKVIKGWFNTQEGTDISKQFTSRWSLLFNDNELSLFDCPKARAIPADQIAKIKQYLSEADLGENYGIKKGLLTNEDAQTLFEKLVRGTPSGFLDPAWVLRNTAIVSKDMPKDLVPMSNYAPVGSVYVTTALLIAKEAIKEDLFIFKPPLGEWLVRPPLYDQDTEGKWQVMQEFWWAERWDDFVYETRITS